MQLFPKKYIVDENNKRVAVQLDIDTYEKMEEVIENHGLAKLMLEQQNEETLTVSEAKAYYKSLGKNNAG